MELIVDRRVYLNKSMKKITKEIAVTSVRSADRGCPRLKLCVFQPPCAWEELSAECQEANLEHFQDHGIPWEAGTISFKSRRDVIRKILFRSVRTLFVYGEENREYFVDFFKGHVKVRNLQEYGCPDPLTLPPLTHTHLEQVHEGGVGKRNCALEIVGRMKAWFETWWGIWGIGIARQASITPLSTPLADYQYMQADFLANAAGVVLIDSIWQYLPCHLKQDPRITRFLRCDKHYNNRIFGGGSRPFIDQCKQCVEEKVLEAKTSENFEHEFQKLVKGGKFAHEDKRHDVSLIEKNDIIIIDVINQCVSSDSNVTVNDQNVHNDNNDKYRPIYEPISPAQNFDGNGETSPHEIPRNISAQAAEAIVFHNFEDHNDLLNIQSVVSDETCHVEWGKPTASEVLPASLPENAQSIEISDLDIDLTAFDIDDIDENSFLDL